MISILIPVFNFEIVPLVNELIQQLEELDIQGEILVFDDFSTPSCRNINKSLIGLNNVVYKELDKNYGRTSIRQLLASQAHYEWLLFLDCDSRILKSDFLRSYLSAFKQNFDVYVGGRTYPTAPADCSKKLHWKYGTKRESIKGKKTAFQSNNFCIKKEVFQQIQFPVFLKEYGHEDTWIGIELERSGKSIQYIDNAVEHVQIETAENFLKKTEQALRNLLQLKTVASKKTIARHVSLFKAYSFINSANLEFVVNFISGIFKSRIVQNLNSCNPSLLFFDFYRLHRLIQISRSK
jgi:glycosyltransferase involved in cell wall biosynthesis